MFSKDCTNCFLLTRWKPPENIICFWLANYAFAFPHLAEALTALNFLKALLRKIKLEFNYMSILHIYYLLGSRECHTFMWIHSLIHPLLSGPQSVPGTARYQSCYLHSSCKELRLVGTIFDAVVSHSVTSVSVLALELTLRA